MGEKPGENDTESQEAYLEITNPWTGELVRFPRAGITHIREKNPELAGSNSSQTSNLRIDGKKLPVVDPYTELLDGLSLPTHQKERVRKKIRENLEML